MRKNFPIIAICTLLALSACGPKYAKTHPIYSPVTEAVFSSGSIDPKDAYTLTSLSDGFIVKSYVTEGDIVHDGQLLFQLDNRQQNTQVAIAKNNLQYADINAAATAPALLQIKAQMDAAMAKMQTDSVTLMRYRQLYATNSVSKQDLDNAQLNYESSASNYRAQLESYRATQDKARQDLANSREQLQNAVAGNQYYNLQAIGESKVYQIFKKQGDLVRKGDQVAQLGNPDSIVVNLDVDEGSIAKVRVGQQVLVELNTQKNITYEGYVSKIYPHFNETSQSYKVEARFLKQDNNLIAGTQLQANIVISKKDKSMVIPTGYVFNKNKVLVKRGGKLDTMQFTPGIISDNWTEVLGGLTTDDEIVTRQ
jgi:HlyD family secretion protein